MLNALGIALGGFLGNAQRQQDIHHQTVTCADALGEGLSLFSQEHAAIGRAVTRSSRFSRAMVSMAVGCDTPSLRAMSVGRASPVVPSSRRSVRHNLPEPRSTAPTAPFQSGVPAFAPWAAAASVWPGLSRACATLHLSRRIHREEARPWRAAGHIASWRLVAALHRPALGLAKASRGALTVNGGALTCSLTYVLVSRLIGA